jgi:polysaccharide biosynthesis protein PslJ
VRAVPLVPHPFLPGPGQTRPRRHPLDPLKILWIVIGLAMLVPAHLVVPGVTGIGRPVIVFGAALAGAWFLAALHPYLAVPGPQPLRWAAAAFLAAILLSYASGFLRGLPPLEANAADRSLIIYLVYVGLALICADAALSRSRLHSVLTMLLAAGLIMALIGHLQFAFDVNLVEHIYIPGLAERREVIDFRARGGGFMQVASTALHYIEFSSVMALLVPFGIHAARFSRTARGRQVALASALMIAAAVPITLSRTGIVGLALSLLILSFFWGWRVRYTVTILAMGMVAALMLLQPGLLGTIRAIFVHAPDDPSIQGRTEDYGPIFGYVSQRPLLGRGPGTFIPDLYRQVDNDWLVHLVTIGVIGTATYAAWHLTALVLAAIAYRRARREADRHLCACLIVTQVNAMVVASFFDAMAFTTHTTVLAILTGAAGAMWRLTHPSRRVRDTGTATRGPQAGPTSRHQQLGADA